jgi:streptogrisin B
MEKTFYKAITLILVFILTFSTSIFASGRNELTHHIEYESSQNVELAMYIQNYFISTYGIEFVRNHNESVQTHMEIINNFPRNRLGEIIHPDSFGGAFIDDNGKLVMLLVENSFGFMDNIGVSASRNVGSVFVEFSYNYLNSVVEYLLFLANEDSATFFGLAESFSIDIVGNRIEVTLVEYTQMQIDRFRTYVFDSPALSFAPSNGAHSMDIETLLYFPTNYDVSEDAILTMDGDILNISPHSSSISSGVAINIDGGISSTGFRVRRGNEFGFVTAAHGLNRNGVHVRLGRSSAGSVIGTFNMDNVSRTTDAVFIPLTANYSMNNWVPSGMLSASSHAPVQGSLVITLGATTHINGGRVSNTGRSAVIDGHTVWVVEVDFGNRPLQLGDSGGLVYVELGQLNLPAGMIVGRRTDNNSIGAFVRADQIHVALRTSLH